MKGIVIRPATPGDLKAIRNVNYLAFGEDSEAWLVDALREGGYTRVSLVADRDGLVVGHILFSDLSVSTKFGEVGALALAPLAVLPDVQNQGIGSALVQTGLEVCKVQGHKIIVVLGHEEFFQRFGFTSELADQFASPFSGDVSFMVLELDLGALDGLQGQVQYPPPFELWV